MAKLLSSVLLITFFIVCFCKSHTIVQNKTNDELSRKRIVQHAEKHVSLKPNDNQKPMENPGEEPIIGKLLKNDFPNIDRLKELQHHRHSSTTLPPNIPSTTTIRPPPAQAPTTVPGAPANKDGIGSGSFAAMIGLGK